MNENEIPDEIMQEIEMAEILRNGIKPFGDDYIIHGAIKEIIKWHEKTVIPLIEENKRLRELLETKIKHAAWLEDESEEDSWQEFKTENNL